VKILINDYCGFSFPFDLSLELAKRGHSVLHMFTSASGGPKAIIKEIPSNLEVIDIEMRNIEKQNFIKRWGQEKTYGAKAIGIISRFKPNVVISSNTPLAAHRIINKYCYKKKIGYIFWLQDIIAVAVRSIFKKKLGVVGTIIGIIFKIIEKKILDRSDHIVTISEDFIDTISNWGIKNNKTTVISNWSPIEQIPVLHKNNSFSVDHGLEKKFVIIYSGTMGMKHDPYIISKTAKQLKNELEILFVVITDGLGMDVLKEQKRANQLDNLLLLDLQPFEIFPKVLAAGDVILTLLEKEAGVYSVPSKVWSGYCAGRPSILIMPNENLAAKRTKEIQAGVVIPNDESHNLADKILELKNNPELCKTYGKNARRFAEENFRIEKIANRFETIFYSVVYA